MIKQKTSAQIITSTLKKGSKKGMTAQTIAERTGLKLNTVRFTLNMLVQEQAARIIGTQKLERGRPANLYTIFA